MPAVNNVTETLYSDKLVDISHDILTFHDYYFFGVAKKVSVKDVESIQTLPPGVSNGSWRIWGTSGPGGWMPLDWHRPSRDRIFILHYKNKKFLIDFTVENSALAENALKQIGLVKPLGDGEKK